MNTKILKILLGLFVTGILLTVFYFGDYVVFVLASIFVFVFMVIRIICSTIHLSEKILQFFVYALIMVLQILYFTLLVFSHSEESLVFVILKLTSTALILLSPIIEKVLFQNNNETFVMPSLQADGTFAYSQLIYEKERIIEGVETCKRITSVFNKENIGQVLKELSNNSSCRYVNNGSLTKEYENAAYSSLEDDNIYIVLTDSGSPASEMLSVFTCRRFNHVSLSFDSDLKTIISYNGGQNVHMPGLNHEIIEALHNKPDSSILVYSLKITKEQKRKIIEKVLEINCEGSAYNLLGLVLKFTLKPNIMFCSQFVYQMLQYAGVGYFDKKNTKVKPTDLVELDYHRKLKFAYEIKFNG